MTELLQRIIAELEKLPEEEQDAIATRWIDECAHPKSSEHKTRHRTMSAFARRLKDASQH